MPHRKIRIVLADDHEQLRGALASLLMTIPGVEIAGEASDGRAAIELVRRILPDIVIMDMVMPGMSGLEATRIIHADLPQVQVIGLSMLEEADIGAEMRRAGAANYISKTAPANTLLDAIRDCQLALPA